jgi:hypothetical protein
MSLKYFADKLMEQIKGLEGFSDSFDRLVALADRKPDELIEEWEQPELFDWLCLFDKEWKEDPTPQLKWNSFADNTMYHVFIDEKDNRYLLQMSVGQGTAILFCRLGEKQKSLIAYHNCSTSFMAVKTVAEQKLEFLREKLGEITMKQLDEEAKQTDYKRRIKAVETAKELLALYGMKIAPEAEKELQKWKDDLTELRDPSGIARMAVKLSKH